MAINDRLWHELRVTAFGERISTAAGRARPVCNLLGQHAERHRGVGRGTNYWTKVAYTVPDTPHASIKPGETNVKMVPIGRMVPRFAVTNITG
jgi:hypothetical protein